MTTSVIGEYVYSGHSDPHTAPYLWPVAEKAISGHRRVLDLGCGTGAFSVRLSALGHEVVGVDSSTSGIRVARQTHHGIAFLHTSEAIDLEAFDAVVCLEVIEHCYAPRDLLQTIRSALRPNGLLVLSTPYHGYAKNLALAITGQWDAHLTALWDHGHIKFFSRNTLGVLLSEAGFEGVRFRRVGRIPPFAKSLMAEAHLSTQAQSSSR